MSGSMLLLPVFVPIAAGIAYAEHYEDEKSGRCVTGMWASFFLFSLLCAAFFLSGEWI